MKTETIPAICRDEKGRFCKPPEPIEPPLDPDDHREGVSPWLAAFIGALILIAVWALILATPAPRPPEPARLLPHSAIAIPEPFEAPRFDDPPPVIFHFYDVHPTVHRNINFNGNQR